MLKPWPKKSALPAVRLGAIASAYRPRWAVSGARIMMTSASAAASAGVSTRRPCSSAFGRLFEPTGRPITTSTPESRSDSAWAWPWLPYPITATLRPWIRPRSASSS